MAGISKTTRLALPFELRQQLLDEIPVEHLAINVFPARMRCADANAFRRDQQHAVIDTEKATALPDELCEARVTRLGAVNFLIDFVDELELFLDLARALGGFESSRPTRRLSPIRSTAGSRMLLSSLGLNDDDLPAFREKSATSMPRRSPPSARRLATPARFDPNASVRRNIPRPRPSGDDSSGRSATKLSIS